MSFFSWLRNQTSNRYLRGRWQRRPVAQCFRPRLEALEDRWMPSTLNVTNLGDGGNKGSLRYEIAAAQSGDAIVFDKKLDGGTITLLSGELLINKSLTIQGPGWSILTITSPRWLDRGGNAHNGSRIFEVDGGGTTVAISGLTLTRGGGTRYGNGVSGYPNDGYGGAILNFGSLTLSNCKLGGGTLTLAGNAAEYGGAIANFGQMTVSGCNVYGNSASSTFGSFNEGGGIYNAGTMTVTNCEVQNNSAYGTFRSLNEGGGIYNAGTMTVSGSYVVINSAGTGGGIYNAGTAAALTVLDSIFGNNSPDNIFGPYTDGGGNTFR